MENFSCLHNPSMENVTQVVCTLDHPNASKGIENGYWCAAAALFILLCGTPLNVFVIVTILWKRLYKNTSVILMLNLAISNLLVCLLILPFIVVSGYSSEFAFGSSDYVRCIFCPLGSVIITLSIVSLSTLALMSVGRLLYLKKPLRYSSIVTPARVLALLVVVWVISITAALPPYFGFGSIIFSYTVSTCVPTTTGDTHGLPNVYYLFILAPIALLLVLVLMVIYIWIVCISRQYILKNPMRFALLNKQFVIKLNSLPKNGPSYDEEVKQIIHNANKRQQFRMVQVLGAIILTNLITWLPTPVVIFTRVILGTSVIPTISYSIAYICFLLEIMLHPLLQIVLVYELKETLKKVWLSFYKMFCICFRCNDGSEN